MTTDGSTKSSKGLQPPAAASRISRPNPQIITALRQQPKSVAHISTGVVEPESYEEARRAGGIGDRPLIVLAAGQPMDFGDLELNRQAAAYQQAGVHEMQTGWRAFLPAAAKLWLRTPITRTSPQMSWLTQFVTSWQMSGLPVK
jgi:hypothetical protein